jgi:hypothetical protein
MWPNRRPSRRARARPARLDRACASSLCEVIDAVAYVVPAAASVGGERRGADRSRPQGRRRVVSLSAKGVALSPNNVSETARDHARLAARRARGRRRIVVWFAVATAGNVRCACSSTVARTGPAMTFSLGMMFGRLLVGAIVHCRRRGRHGIARRVLRRRSRSASCSYCCSSRASVVDVPGWYHAVFLLSLVPWCGSGCTLSAGVRFRADRWPLRSCPSRVDGVGIAAWMRSPAQAMVSRRRVRDVHMRGGEPPFEMSSTRRRSHLVEYRSRRSSYVTAPLRRCARFANGDARRRHFPDLHPRGAWRKRRQQA